MFIPDTTDNAKSYELTFDRLARWVVLFVCVIALVICLFVSVILRNNEMIYGENGYIAQMEALKEENERLQAELSGEGASSAELSRESVTEQAGGKSNTDTADGAEPEGSEEETDGLIDEEAPEVLPINGTATVIKDPTSEASEYPDRIVFLALKDSEVTAGAGGVVKEIYRYEQEKNEFSVALLLDHRNGYETVYLMSGEPKLFVQKGMRIGRGEALAKLLEDESIVGYDILYGGTSLNPAELLGEAKQE